MDTQATHQVTTPLVDYKLFDNVADKRIFQTRGITKRRTEKHPELDNVMRDIPKQKPHETILSKKRISKAKKSGLKPRSLFYTYVQSYTQEAIEMMVYLMRTSRNEGIRLGAARSILDKSIPDLKALEISGELKQQYTLQLQQYAPTDPLQAFKAREHIIDGKTEAKTDTLQDTMSDNIAFATLPSLETEQSNTISPNTSDTTHIQGNEATQKL